MKSKLPAPESLLPLPPATFYILLALTDGERHGYAIMKDVSESTGGEVRLGPGTLYGAIKRLLASGIVAETERADSDGDDERRRYYRLTSHGVAVARAEAKRLGGMVRAAQARRLIGAKLA